MVAGHFWRGEFAVESRFDVCGFSSVFVISGATDISW